MALNNLGVIFSGSSDGLALPRNDVLAVRYLKKAAEKGDVKASLNMATMISKGRGGPEKGSEKFASGCRGRQWRGCAEACRGAWQEGGLEAGAQMVQDGSKGWKRAGVARAGQDLSRRRAAASRGTPTLPRGTCPRLSKAACKKRTCCSGRRFRREARETLPRNIFEKSHGGQRAGCKGGTRQDGLVASGVILLMKNGKKIRSIIWKQNVGELFADDRELIAGEGVVAILVCLAHDRCSLSRDLLSFLRHVGSLEHLCKLLDGERTVLVFVKEFKDQVTLCGRVIDEKFATPSRNSFISMAPSASPSLSS